MKLSIFPIPIYIGNIDVDKIKIEHKGFDKNFFSETKSSFRYQNELKDGSGQYLLNTIYNLIKKDVKSEKKIQIHLSSIWENKYEKKDYQEKHIHTQSHFSFVIYKKINKSKTVFINPADKLILGFYPDIFLNNTNFFELNFQPECRQGQIVLFPSFLEHLVRQSDNCTTISGNVSILIENINQNDKV